MKLPFFSVFPLVINACKRFFVSENQEENSHPRISSIVQMNAGSNKQNFKI